MTPYVYRRPWDYCKPTPQWLLLRPDLDVTGVPGTLSLVGLTATITKGAIVAAVPGTLALSGVQADINQDRSILATLGSLGLAGQQSVVTFLDTTAFTHRVVPMLVPEIKSGVYRQSFTVRRVGQSRFTPRLNTTGLIDVNRGELSLTGLKATINFDETVKVWLLHEAVRVALLRRQIAFREPVDMRPWTERTVQFTVPTQNLTAYTRELTLTGHQSTVLVSRGVQADLAVLALSAPKAAVRLAKNILANAGALTLTGHAARIGTGRTVTAVQASLTLAGQQADAADLNKAVNAQPGVLILSGLSSSFGENLTIAAKVAVMALAGQHATARVEKAVAALTAELILTAHDAVSQVDTDVAATEAVLSLTGAQADIRLERIIEAAVASLTLDSQLALIEGTTALVVQVGARTIRIPTRNPAIKVH